MMMMMMMMMMMKYEIWYMIDDKYDNNNIALMIPQVIEAVLDVFVKSHLYVPLLNKKDIQAVSTWSSRNRPIL